MNRFAIVLGHAAFYANNYVGQGDPMYKRLSKIYTYYDPGVNWYDLNAHGEPDAVEVYDNLAKKHGLPPYGDL